MEHEAKCEYCNKKLRSFKTTFDWGKRKLHKTCYKKQLDNLHIK